VHVTRLELGSIQQLQVKFDRGGDARDGAFREGAAQAFEGMLAVGAPQARDATGASVGAVALFDLRLLGFSPTVSIRSLERHLLPWAWAALLLIVPSGVAMLSAHATEFAANPAFRIKLVLIAFAGINAIAFHTGVYRSVSSWDQHQPTPAAAKASAALSLALWLGVIACGRLIAYL